MISLIVKGTVYQATAEALRRSILLGEVREHVLPGHVETLAKCHDTFWPEVQQWYLEPPRTQPPYPVGTLLWCAGSDKAAEDAAVAARLEAEIAELDLNWKRKRDNA